MLLENIDPCILCHIWDEEENKGIFWKPGISFTQVLLTYFSKGSGPEFFLMWRISPKLVRLLS